MVLSSPCKLCTNLPSVSCQPELPLHESNECGSNPCALGGAWISIKFTGKKPKRSRQADDP
jgi:hypothetical protein